jgi:hypothetical protein
MADQSRDLSKSKTETEEKQPETVILSAEELRAISGGVFSSPGPTKPTPKVIVRER